MAKSLREKLLELVESEPGLTISEAATRLGAAKSSISLVSRLLEREGLIERRRKGSVVLLYPATRPAPEGEGLWEGVEGRLPGRLRLGIIRAAEYPFVVVFAKKLRRSLGVELVFRVYSNGIQATLDLVSGRLDLALTPLPTQALYYALTSSLRVIAGGAYGGSYILESPASSVERVYTTKASAMEACVNMSGVSGERVYASSGEEIVEALARGRAGYAALWEPYASQAEALGARRLMDCSELGLTHCCTLAASTRLPVEARRRLARTYREALEDYARSPGRVVEAYSRITGIPAGLLSRTLKSYRVEPEVTRRDVAKLLAKAGALLPSPEAQAEAVEEY